MNSSKTIQDIMNPDHSVIFRISVFAGLLLIIILGLPVIQTGQPVYSKVAKIHFSYTLDSNPQAMMLCPEGWSETNVSDFDILDKPVFLCANLNIYHEKVKSQPIGLYISAQFSSEIYWDGVLIGNNGVVGETPDQEEPGKIDYVVNIPDYLSVPGQHTLFLKVSSHHVKYRTSGLIHFIGLGPYREDARRSLRYYLLPIILGSSLLIFAAQFLRMAKNARGYHLTALCIFSIFVFLQLAGELSRSFISYAYDWHLLRSTLIWLAATLAGLSLNLLILPGRSFDKIIVLLGLTSGLVWSFFAIGFDSKTLGVTLILMAAPAYLAVKKAFADKSAFWGMIPILWVFWVMSMELDPVLFLDGTYYATTVAFLFCALMFSQDIPRATIINQQAKIGPRTFVVSNRGEKTLIDTDSVTHLVAAGNYTELHTEGGKVYLHQKRLGAIMENPPNGFIRIHRSYAANKSFVRKLKTHIGSRYRLALESGEEIPVSRYRMAEVRSNLTK